jgi:hypothetical protein
LRISKYPGERERYGLERADLAATWIMERLPSGSWRAKVYAGTDPLTDREILLMCR